MDGTLHECTSVFDPTRRPPEYSEKGEKWTLMSKKLDMTDCRSEVDLILTDFVQHGSLKLEIRMMCSLLCLAYRWAHIDSSFI